MACAECLQLAVADDQFLDLLDRFGMVQSGGAVGIIAGPVALILRHLRAPSASLLSFVSSLRMNSSTCSPSTSASTVSSPQILNPHFSKTRRDPILCFATWAYSGRADT